MGSSSATDELTLESRIADAALTRSGDVLCVFAKIGHSQIMQKESAIGVRIRSHPPIADRRQFGQFGLDAALLVEQFFRAVAPKPFF